MNYVGTEQKHAVLSFCPYSGSIKRGDIDIGAIVENLRSNDWAVQKHELTDESSISDLNGSLSAKDLLIVVGGDGTVRDTVDQLIKGGIDTTIAVIPGGTSNVFASHLGLLPDAKNDIDHVLSTINHGREVTVDVGLINGMHFVVDAGNGPMARAITTPGSEVKSILGRFAYAPPLLGSLLDCRVRYRITIDDRVIVTDAAGVFVTNVAAPVVADRPRLEKLQNGTLELFVINPASLDDYLKFGYNLVEQFFTPESKVEQAYKIASVKKVLIEPIGTELTFGESLIPGGDERRESLLMVTSVDGDEFSMEALEVEAVPGAIRTLVPAEHQKTQT